MVVDVGPAVGDVEVGAVAGAPPAVVFAGVCVAVPPDVGAGSGVTVTVAVAVAVAVTVSTAGWGLAQVTVLCEPSGLCSADGVDVQDAVVSMAPAMVVTPSTRVRVVPAATRARLP